MARQLNRWLALLNLAAGAVSAQQQDLPTPAPGSHLDRLDIEVGARYVSLISGSTRAQGPPALRLNPRLYDLKRELGVEDGYSPFAKVTFAASQKDSLSFTISQNNLEGETTLTAPVIYNNRSIPPGRAETTSEVTIFDFLYHRQLLATADAVWSVEGSIGARHFAAVAHINRRGGGGDQEEYESFLVPAFGAKLTYRPMERWEFALDASGSAPGDVFELSDEPANIGYWTADLIATYRISRHFRVNGGVRFADLDIDFSGEEVDHHFAHNVLRTLTIEPFLSITLRF